MATGLSGVLGLALLILFFTFGEPFGSLNDACIGLTGIMSGVLAISSRTKFVGVPGALDWGFAFVAILGGVVVALGAVTVIFGFRGWYLAGLTMAAGNGLIGLWLLWSAVSGAGHMPLFGGLITLQIIASAVMLVGLAAIPGVFKGLDAWQSPPWHSANVGQFGALGYLVIYPLWCLLAGRFLLQG